MYAQIDALHYPYVYPYGLNSQYSHSLIGDYNRSIGYFIHITHWIIVNV